MNRIDKIDFEPEATEQSNVRKAFLSLNESIRKEMQGKSIDFIFNETSIYQTRLKRDGKKLKLHLKQVADADFENALKEKLSTYNSKTYLFLRCMKETRVFAGMVPEKYRGVFGLAQQAFKLGSNIAKSHDQGRYQKAEHRYQTIQELSRGHRSDMQSSDQDWKELQQNIDTINRSTEKMFETLLSGA